eukprot:383227_1
MSAEEKITNDNTTKQIPSWNTNNCVYTSCYCEENVWNLCDKVRKEGRNLNDYFAIFLSNNNKSFPIWHARSAKSNDKPVIWDYHVIFLWFNKQNPIKSLIFDLDTTLSFPCLIEEYIKKAFQYPQLQLKDQYKHNFRVVNSQIYLDKFYSDRQHMYINKQWIATPPQYPCIMIKNKKKGSNLMSHFVSMNNKKIGCIYKDVPALYQWIKSAQNV